MSYLWPRSGSVVLDNNGRPAIAAYVEFYDAGTNDTITTYEDSDLTTPHQVQVSADGAARWPAIYIDYGSYRERAFTASGAALWDFDGIDNPAPPDSGGGGGIVVTADEILQTGDTMWRLIGGTRTGWVRMNGRTIGSAVSGATERANDDTLDLYTYIYNGLSDAIAPVVGGRGPSAATDFAAGKPITVPTMQGILAAGVDDMGGSAANRIQIATTISTTNASATATVASAAGLAVGMYIVSTNVPAGTTINAISGTTLTLSANATATASGVAARFSFFTDAQTAGALGGAATSTLVAAQVPELTGATSTDGQHQHGYKDGQALGVGGATGGIQGVNSTDTDRTTGAAGNHSHTVTVNTGGGQPHSIVQPTRLGTWYMKL